MYPFLNIGIIIEGVSAYCYQVESNIIDLDACVTDNKRRIHMVIDPKYNLLVSNHISMYRTRYNVVQCTREKRL